MIACFLSGYPQYQKLNKIDRPDSWLLALDHADIRLMLPLNAEVHALHGGPVFPQLAQAVLQRRGYHIQADAHTYNFSGFAQEDFSQKSHYLACTTQDAAILKDRTDVPITFEPLVEKEGVAILKLYSKPRQF
jgi:hypothetical protein